MLLPVILAPLLALIPPAAPAATASPAPGASGSPVPSATPRELRTIVTVVSSPYCNALEQHFNSALVPMLANDRVFQVVDVQLDDMNHMFDYPDYIQRFTTLRVKMIDESGKLVASLKAIQQQIDQLRQSAALTTDPAAAQQMRDAAGQLQDAYKHQFQLSTDLSGLAQSMMQYNVFRGGHPLGGWTPYENTLPQDEKNIKVYLHYPQQISSIDTAEDKAVDIAYTIAQDRCTK